MRMRKSAIISLIVIAILGAISAGGYLAYKLTKYQKEAAPAAVEITKIQQKATQQATQETGTQQPSVNLPEELNLKMTFYPQAPFGDWSLPWQEACEEASILLVANEYLGKNWTLDQFNTEILNMVDWEKINLGDYLDSNVKEMVRILTDYLGLKAIVYDDPTYEDVQKVLARGHFIIMPFDGKKIGNPFYKNGGPVYHVMVIKGYKPGEKIITSDVGTSRGENYVYAWKTLQNAMHDYAVPMSAGAKRMIEVIPPAF
jgi:hypothetical protein